MTKTMNLYDRMNYRMTYCGECEAPITYLYAMLKDRKENGVLVRGIMFRKEMGFGPPPTRCTECVTNEYVGRHGPIRIVSRPAA